ncbi:MAG: hypothetical protein FWF22_10835 [Treponema sp.]|nr:hypothetical protein [Treponema sp.]
MNHWNNYLWPLIIIQSQESQTMPLLTSVMIAGYTVPMMIMVISQRWLFAAGVPGAVKS